LTVRLAISITIFATPQCDVMTSIDAAHGNLA